MNVSAANITPPTQNRIGNAYRKNVTSLNSCILKMPNQIPVHKMVMLLVPCAVTNVRNVMVHIMMTVLLVMVMKYLCKGSVMVAL